MYEGGPNGIDRGRVNGLLDGGVGAHVKVKK